MKHGGQILVDGLLSLGAKHGFCVPGESYLAVLDGFYEAGDKFQLITCRHEGGASYMAEAYGKISGTPGLCFVTRGPGAANAMIGVHTAFQDSTPMLLFIGQVERQHKGREAFQELSYEAVYGSVAKAVLRIDSASRINEILSHAWALSLSGRPGPVVIELPEDMLREECDAETLRTPAIAKPSPSADDMARAVTVLKAAKKPLMIIGGAGWSSDASRRATKFAEQNNIPVITAFRRQDSIDNHHPNYIGELSVVSPAHVTDALSASDCLIIISARFGDITSGGYERLPVPYNDKKLIHVHVSADELQHVYYATVPVVSTADNFLQILETHEFQKFWSDEDLKTFKKSYDDIIDNPPMADGEKLSMAKISEYLRENLPADSIITAGAGNYTIWGQRQYKYSHWQTEIACTNGSMGYAVASALGARTYNKTAPIVCFAGDGCFLMTAQELATAVQYDLPVIILVVNNGSLATIRTHQQRDYPNRKMATDLQNPDFAAFAKSFGAFGARVEKTNEFAPSFEAAQKSGKPAVIDLIWDVAV